MSVKGRLLRRSKSIRAFLVLSIALGIVVSLLALVQSWTLAVIISSASVPGNTLAQIAGSIGVLAIVVLLRSGVTWYREVVANRSSARAMSEMRMSLLDKITRLGPRGLADKSTGAISALTSSGIQSLHSFYALYVPRLVLAAVVPLILLVAIATQDWLSSLLLAVTLPLIPLFMALIGLASKTYADRRMASLQRFAGHFVDVVAGLTTLKTFGRSKPQINTIREASNHYRHTTMATLRLTFLSSLVLELIASLSVALVAVAIGLRLLSNTISYRTALFVLILTPEVYLPLRNLAAGYHASADAVSAATEIFDIIDRDTPVTGTSRIVPDVATHALVVNDLTIKYPGARRPALEAISMRVEPGEVVAITGPSGCGKSTLLAVLLGFVGTYGGSVHIGNTDLTTLDLDAWRTQISWLPQHPYIFATSIRDNICLGQPRASGAAINAAVSHAGLDHVVSTLPNGMDTQLREGGTGLSAGERQRVAIARAFLRDSPLLLLDEPTSNLDGATEAEIISAVRQLAKGRTTLIVAHRPALLPLADRVIHLDKPRVMA